MLLCSRIFLFSLHCIAGRGVFSVSVLSVACLHIEHRLESPSFCPFPARSDAILYHNHVTDIPVENHVVAFVTNAGQTLRLVFLIFFISMRKFTEAVNVVAQHSNFLTFLVYLLSF